MPGNFVMVRFMILMLILSSSLILNTAVAQEEVSPQEQPPANEENNVSQPDNQSEALKKKESLKAESARVENLDIIFVIDASSSLNWNDPDLFKNTIVNSFIDITQNKGGGWLSVSQFAGWNETIKNGAILCNLTQIPTDSKVREFLLNEIKNSVDAKMGAFGTATDFNCAFDVAVKEILEQREKVGDKNKVWIILVSDGSMEVVEGDKVRDVYQSRVERQGKRVNHPNLNEAANEIFSEEVLAKIAQNENLFITFVNLGKGEPSDIPIKIGKLSNGQLINATQDKLKDVFVGIFSGLPRIFPDYLVGRGFGYVNSEVAPGSILSSTFHVYQGAAATNLIILGNTNKFSIDLKNQSGNSIKDNPNVVVRGKKEDLYRLITVTSESVGDYVLDVANESSAPAKFEVMEYVDFDLATFVGTEDLKTEFYPGETLKFEVGLREAKTSSFVNDAALISQAEVLVAIADVEGNLTEKIVKFSGLESTKTLAELELPKDAMGGEYELILRSAAIKDTVSGQYAFLSKPVSIPFSVISPIVDLQFSLREALVGQEVEILGTVTAGSFTEKQKKEGIKAKVVSTISHSEKEVPMLWNEQTGKLSGKVVLDEIKEWKLQIVQMETGQMRPSDPDKILIKPRELRIIRVDKDNNRIPLDKLTINAKPGEEAIEKFIVEVDLGEKETGNLSASFAKSMQEARLYSGLSGINGVTELTPENARADLFIKLEMQKWPQKTDIGELTLTAKIGELVIEEKVLVDVKLPPKPFPWTQAGIITASVLFVLLMLLVLFGGPVFDQQQIYIVGGSGHHLKEWKISKTKATGTVEISGSLMFRLKGTRGRPVCFVMPGKRARVFVNNIECLNWTQISHGNYVEIYPEKSEYSYRYRYFEHTPTTAELQVAEEMTKEMGTGVLLGEDEFILAEDDEGEFMAATDDATQALLLQAQRMKETSEPSRRLTIPPKEKPEKSQTEAFVEPGEMVTDEFEIVEEEAESEAVDDMGKATQQILTEGFEIVEETEQTQDVPSVEDTEATETIPPSKKTDRGITKGKIEPVKPAASDESDFFTDSEDAGVEATQPIATEYFGEETESISKAGQEFKSEETVEMFEFVDENKLENEEVEMTEFVEEKTEEEKPQVTEFIDLEHNKENEEIKPVKKPAKPEATEDAITDMVKEDDGIIEDTDFAKELDKTFDDILGSEKDEKDKNEEW